MQPDGFEERLEGMPSLVEGTHGVQSACPHAHAQTETGVGNHWLNRMRQQRQVGRVVANVTEGGGIQPDLQEFQFSGASQVNGSV